MAKRFIGFLLLTVYNFAFVSSASAATAFAAETPEAVVDYLHAGLEALGDNGNTTIGQRYASLAPIILNSYDLPYIGELMLRRFWEDLSPEERRLFLQRFERLSILDYASRFESLNSNSFRHIEKVTLSERRVRVVAELLTPERTVEFVYTLNQTLNQDEMAQWRIVGITADGVSEQAMRRSEYTRIMNTGGFPALLAFMEERIEALEAE